MKPIPREHEKLQPIWLETEGRQLTENHVVPLFEVSEYVSKHSRYNAFVVGVQNLSPITDTNRMSNLIFPQLYDEGYENPLLKDHS